MKKQLPSGWMLASIGMVATFVRGVTYSKKYASKEPAVGRIPVLRANNINDGLKFSDLVYVPNRFVSDEQIVLDGDVVLAMSSGSKKVVGKAAIAKSPPRCGFGAFCGVIRPSKNFNSALLGYFFQTKAYRNAVSEKSKGVNINNLKAEHILEQLISIPPREEQARITSKIDELFSRISEGERALEQVRKLVERYRQSVLKAAVTGELTREWREKNKNRLESGEALLARILKARREAWEQAELEKMRAKGVKPKNDDWKKKYKEPVAPDTSDLPELPEGWAWGSLSLLSGVPSTNGISVKGSDRPPGIPALRLDAMKSSGFDYSARRYIPITKEKAKRLYIEAGDFFVSRANGSLALVGRAVLAQPTAEKIVFPDTMIRYRLIPSPSCHGWLERIWSSRFIRAQLECKAKTTAGIYKISQADLSEVAIPIPSEAEQQVASSMLDECISRMRGLVREAARAERGASALKQAILKSAFSGALVSQDPSEEPASVLLERIVAKREKAVTTRPKREPRKRTITKARAAGGRK